ncbi:hypothetical protein [Streptomyces sp. NPDC001811]
MNARQRLNDAVLGCVLLERRIDPYVRPLFDRTLLRPLQAAVQWCVNVRRRDEHLGLAEERAVPGEAAVAEAIAQQMTRFVRRQYRPGQAQRAGNTKTYGVVHADFTVRDDLPARLRHGVFRTPARRARTPAAGQPEPCPPHDLPAARAAQTVHERHAAPGARSGGMTGRRPPATPTRTSGPLPIS